MGLWRKTFTWNPGLEPSQVFDSEQELKQFCAEHGVKIDDPDYPFLLLPCNHHVFGKALMVQQWTCIGWANYE